MYDFFTLILMRGLPGSGKSSIADTLVGGDVSNKEVNGLRFRKGPCGVVCTTDSYFFDKWKGGEENYNFNPSNLKENHTKNRDAVAFAMRNHTPAIVVDNTNTQQWEMEAYLELARMYAYKVVIVEVPHTDLETCVKRNNHDVPYDVLQTMEDRWETFRIDGVDGDKR